MKVWQSFHGVEAEQIGKSKASEPTGASHIQQDTCKFFQVEGCPLLPARNIQGLTLLNLKNDSPGTSLYRLDRYWEFYLKCC